MMLSKNKKYSLQELLNIYEMYNLDFKYYSNNKKGELELYLKTDIDKISVFKSLKKQTKQDYLNLSENQASKVFFKFDREVNEVDLDIMAIVLRTSDVNIPSTKYRLETLDKLTKEQDLEDRSNSNSDQGISYIIIDNNTACPLYDGYYIFGKDKGGFIQSLESKLEEEKDELLQNNLKLILDYYRKITEEKIL